MPSLFIILNGRLPSYNPLSFHSHAYSKATAKKLSLFPVETDLFGPRTSLLLQPFFHTRVIVQVLLGVVDKGCALWM